jgi:hypothetical protein
MKEGYMNYNRNMIMKQEIENTDEKSNKFLEEARK